MKDSIRAATRIIFGFGIIFLVGCPGVTPDGSTGTATPAPCTVDSDCPEGIACVNPGGEDQGGYCNVDETDVSTGMPASCTGDQDCPDGVSCVFANETDTEGYCDVDETQSTSGTGS